MGNGASSNGTVTVDSDKIEAARLKLLYPEVRSELKKKEQLVEEQKKQIHAYEQEIAALKKEINQLKSVLEATTAKTLTHPTIAEEQDSGTDDDVSSSAGTPRKSAKYGGASSTSGGAAKERFLNVVDKVRSKRFAVSAETTDKDSDQGLTEIEKIPKNASEKKLIVDAFQKNQFLKHLEEEQLKEIVLYMSLKAFKADEHVINEGDPGNALFVVNKGKLQVHQGEKILGNPLGAGVLFGELAILYNCTRTASVKAIDDVEVWTIERTVFQSVMKKTGNMRRDEHFKFLKSVPIFKGLDKDKLYKITEVAEEEFFPEEEYIIREGELGDAFFIIKEGEYRNFFRVAITYA